MERRHWRLGSTATRRRQKDARRGCIYTTVGPEGGGGEKTMRGLHWVFHWNAAFSHVVSTYWRTMIWGVSAVVKGGFS